MKKYKKKFTFVKKIIENKIKINNIVVLYGWVKTKRNCKSKFLFINLYDGTCFNTMQIMVFKNKILNYKEILKITTGCSIKVIGKLIKSYNKKQIYEIEANSIKILGWIHKPDKYPISSKYHSIKYLRKFSHLRPRTNLFGSITRIRHYLIKYLNNFFNKRNFYWIPTPLLTTLNTEGLVNMFKISTLDSKKNFFGKETFLTVSGQLNLESYACSLYKVYNFGPVFRAENSNTCHHLSEFWMLESEVAFYKTKDIIKLIKSMLNYVFKNILKYCFDEIKYLEKYNNEKLILKLQEFIKFDLILLNYKDVIKILKKTRFNNNNQIKWGIDITNEHESFLVNDYFKSTILIKNHPKNIKAFYMRLNKDKKTVSSFDVIMPQIGEVIGGSEREERLKILDSSLKKIDKNFKKNYWWYRDLRKYGSVPHSGFGLGFERLLSFITGIKNVKDLIPFPRTPNNINF